MLFDSILSDRALKLIPSHYRTSHVERAITNLFSFSRPNWNASALQPTLSQSKCTQLVIDEKIIQLIVSLPGKYNIKCIKYIHKTKLKIIIINIIINARGRSGNTIKAFT